jgi:hypothetical protein
MVTEIVFRIAKYRGQTTSPLPVASNGAFTGEHDLKLWDLEGDGKKEIVIAGDEFYS